MADGWGDALCRLPAARSIILDGSIEVSCSSHRCGARLCSVQRARQRIGRVGRAAHEPESHARRSESEAGRILRVCHGAVGGSFPSAEFISMIPAFSMKKPRPYQGGVLRFCCTLSGLTPPPPAHRVRAWLARWRARGRAGRALRSTPGSSVPACQRRPRQRPRSACP